MSDFTEFGQRLPGMDDSTTTAIAALVHGMVGILMNTPPALRDTVFCSFVLSVIANDSDPHSVWRWLKKEVDTHLPAAIAEEQARRKEVMQ